MHKIVFAAIVCGAILVSATPLSAEETKPSFDPTARQKASPVITELSDSIADDRWVTMVYQVENSDAKQFVPILRPLIPQNGHMVAHADSNSLLMCDSYANVRRIIEIVKTLDVAAPRQ